MAKEKSKEKNPYAIVGGVFCAVIAVVIIFVTNLNKPKEEVSETISTYEAQKKCVIMESIGGLSVDNARKYCLSQWNSTDKEDTFRTEIQTRWEERKNETVDSEKLTGEEKQMTLEEIFNSIEGDI